MTLSSTPVAAKFTAGSPMIHILNMTAATAIGLFAIFAVDFINIFYLNRLGEIEIGAAAGYATTLFFFAISIGIGLTIAATALISPALGAGDLPRARRLTRNVHLFAAGLTSLICLVTWPFVGELVSLLGAEGKTHDLAVNYLRIALPSTPFLTSGMVSAAVLRSTGDARRSMWVTLNGALVTLALDPLFIFGFGMGIEGAAIASSISRAAIMVTGLYGIIRVHDLLGPSEPAKFVGDVRAITAIALPAVLTNLATPAANAYVTSAIASFGDGAVAGLTIIGRLGPIAFVGLFAMTGSVGPIIGQNLGARLFQRVRQTFTDALIFTGLYTAGAWFLLAIAYSEIADIMKATGEARSLLAFYCVWLAPWFALMGALFVANATFNNLGRPQFPAYLNWLRATAGTVPFVLAGAHLFGAKGVIAGQMLGSGVFGIIGVALCYRYIARLDTTAVQEERKALSAAALKPEISLR